MSNLKFNYLKLGTIITHWNQNVIIGIVWLTSISWMSEENALKKQADLTLTTKTWSLGNVYKMRCKIGNM